MAQNSVSQLVSLLGGRFIHGGIMPWADSISGIFLVILAMAVLFEFAKTAKENELVKERSFVAVSLMGIILAIQFVIGRNGVGRFDLSIAGDNVLAVIGCMAVALGVILNIIARTQLGSSWSNNIVIYRGQTLVTKGLYRIVRHPLYATIFLISIGLAFQYQNYFSLIIAVAIFLPMLYFRMIREEKILRKYLNGYAEYARLVPMFIPFSLHSFLSVREVSVNSWALRLCRATTVALLLAALYFQFFWLVVFVFILMASSAIFSISRSFLVALYTSIFIRLGVTKEEIVDLNAIRFAQGLGSVLLLCAILLLYAFHHPFGGWTLVSIVAFSTALGSLGYCLGAYIYFLMRKMYHPHA